MTDARSEESRVRRDEYRACLALRHCPGLGPQSWGTLLERYGSAREAVSDAALWRAAGLLPGDAADAFRRGLWRDAARSEEAAADGLGLQPLLYADPAFPPLLRQLPDPPLFLYARGDTGLLSGPAVAVVGSRNASDLGQRLARDIADGLSRSGVTVVSGMAMGIDRAAHLAALNGPGSTVAVWGTGMDVVYPRNHERLAGYLAEGGCIVTEFAPGAPPRPSHFPARNRIIAGLCLGVVLVQATAKSGGLITARLGLEQGREVFVCIGDGTAAFAGCRRLADEGARAVTSAGEVLLELAPAIRDALERNGASRRPRPKGRPVERPLGLLVRQDSGLDWDGQASGPEPVPEPASPAFTGLEGDELAAWEALGGERGAHIDTLARGLGWEVHRLSRVLLELEVRGMVRQLPGMRYDLA